MVRNELVIAPITAGSAACRRNQCRTRYVVVWTTFLVPIQPMEHYILVHKVQQLNYKKFLKDI